MTIGFRDAKMLKFASIRYVLVHRDRVLHKATPPLFTMSGKTLRRFANYIFAGPRRFRERVNVYYCNYDSIIINL